MKALVAFGTKYGSTERVAEEIAAVLRSEGALVTVLDLRSRKQPEVDGFDLVVVGSGICIGSWSKGSLKFLEVNRENLAKKQVALFACSGDAVLGRNPVETSRKLYLDDVAQKFGIKDPISTALFGGVIDFAKYNFLVRSVMKKVGASKSLEDKGVDLSRPYDFRNWDEIRTWAKTLITSPDRPRKMI